MMTHHERNVAAAGRKALDAANAKLTWTVAIEVATGEGPTGTAMLYWYDDDKSFGFVANVNRAFRFESEQAAADFAPSVASFAGHAGDALLVRPQALGVAL